jgi:phosphohistidine phosphatase
VRLYVMRHGPAEDRARSGHDADRALTLEGGAQVRRVVEELRALRGSGGAPAPRILSSPLRRARETAEIAAQVLLGERGGDDVEVREELSLDADPPIPLAAELGAGGADALMIGHQPNVEHLVRTLARGPSPLAAGFCTAMIVALEPEPAPRPPFRWQVRLVVDPRRLP